MIDVKQIAQDLHEAEKHNAPIPFIKQRHPELDWVIAREIAKANDALRLADHNVLLGYKLGWTSEAMRKALGVDRPNWGTLWESNVCSPD